MSTLKFSGFEGSLLLSVVRLEVSDRSGNRQNIGSLVDELPKTATIWINSAEMLVLGTTRVLQDALNSPLGLATTVTGSAKKKNCRSDSLKPHQVEGFFNNSGFLLISVITHWVRPLWQKKKSTQILCHF